MNLPPMKETIRMIGENKSTFIFLLLMFVLLISYLSTKGCGI